LITRLDYCRINWIEVLYRGYLWNILDQYIRRSFDAARQIKNKWDKLNTSIFFPWAGGKNQLVATFVFCGRVELRTENRKKLSELYLTVTVVESFRGFFFPWSQAASCRIWESKCRPFDLNTLSIDLVSATHDHNKLGSRITSDHASLN